MPRCARATRPSAITVATDRIPGDIPVVLESSIDMHVDTSIEIVIAVRRPLIRCGLQSLVPRVLPGVQVLLAANGRELLRLLPQKPLIVLAEAELLAEIDPLPEALHETRLLIVSPRQHVGVDELPGLRSACGHISDGVGEEELAYLLRQVAACRHRSVMQCGDTPCALKESLVPRDLNLSGREQEVLILLGQGLQPREIAVRLRISVKTVECYRSQLKEKLGLRDSRGLLEFALLWRRGLAH